MVWPVTKDEFFEHRNEITPSMSESLTDAGGGSGDDGCSFGHNDILHLHLHIELFLWRRTVTPSFGSGSFRQMIQKSLVLGRYKVPAAGITAPIMEQ